VDYFTRDIISLIKLITVDNKYSGQNNNFNIKLNIFKNYYKQFNITDNVIKVKVYFNILKDNIFNHFFIN
jgi:hypothetical protein